MVQFSVIIPAYNAEKYISSALKSLSDQSFSDFEAICIDDNSSDKTLSLIKKHIRYDKRFKWIKNEKHLGPGASRNIALQRANGKYIACIDADDIAEKDFLKIPYEKLEETKISSVWIKANIYWEEEKKLTPFFIFPFLQNQKEGLLELTTENIVNFPAYSWNKFFRKDCINSEIKWSDGLLFEDVEFYYRFYTQHPNVYVIDKPLYLYRRHKSSIVSKCLIDKNFHKNLFFVTENIYHYLIKNDLFKKYKRAFLELLVQNIREFEKYDNLKPEFSQTVLETLEKINFPKDYEDLDINIFDINSY